MSGIDTIIGLIAPHICIGCGAEGEVLCAKCSELIGGELPPSCGGCKALSANWKTCKSCKSWLEIYAVSASGPYQGMYEQLLRAYKFDYRRSAAGVIAHNMYDASRELGLYGANDEIVLGYIPTAPSRARERGFDHMRLIAREFARLSGMRSPPLLLERRSNRRQLGSSRAQRMEQMRDEYVVAIGAKIEGKTILLLDDVMTTGASLSAAASVLKSAGAMRIYAATFARGV